MTQRTTTVPLLSVRDIAVRFGGITALDGVSFDIMPGIVMGLIGPNGAGKTTLFNCLSRLYQPSSGDILFDGVSILSRPAHHIAAIGIGRTFQNLALLPKLTVRENVKVGGHSRLRGNVVADALRLPSARRQDRELEAASEELIAYLELTAVAERPAGDLPFGTQKRVELARALMTQPQLLLLDEPAAGLNHGEVDELGRIIRQVRDDRNVTVLLVEHHMGLVMSVSDRIVALNFGRKIGEGTPQEIQANPQVAAAYLGEEANVPAS